MIQIETLHYQYPPSTPGGEWLAVLDGLSLRVEPGECVAVTGANGSGKSTLCLAAAGLAPRLAEGRIEGTIRVAGRDVQREKPGALADLIGLVMQEPAGQLFNPTVEEEIAWGLENLGIPRDEMPVRIEQALALVGLAHLPRTQAPQTLSGGEAKRLALASALALQPRVLILDEPSGGLAPAARNEMVEVLRRLRAEGGATILMAESEPEVIAALADRVAVLHAGRIGIQGKPREVYAEMDAARFPGISLPPAVRFGRAAAEVGVRVEGLAVEEVAKELHDKLPHPPTLSDLTPRPPLHYGEGESAIELQALAFAYDPARPVLRGIDLAIPRGQFAALTGDNGAGKTTLAKHLIGLLRPAAGQVRILGEDAAGQSIGRLARQVGFAFQNPETQIFSATVREEIAFGPRNLGFREDVLAHVVEDAMQQFELARIAEQPPAALSFSARRMVALASIAAMQTPIVVLDEPTVGLDAAGQARVMAWLKAHQQAGGTILLITHDMELVAAHAERVIVLDAGQIAADGTPRQVFRQMDALARAGLEAPFAVRLAEALGDLSLAGDLTPEGAARAWAAR